MTHEARARVSPLPVALILLVAALSGRAESAEGPLDRIDPRLHDQIRLQPAVPVRVWAEFPDKGQRDPEELRAMLARAESELTPRNRARRLRARVRPLVDECDLPVSERYLAELAARGFAPHAVSRWLNRAAVLIPAEGLPRLAALPFVQRVEPVERVARSHDPAAFAAADGAPGPSLLTPPAAGGTVSYGQLDRIIRQIEAPALHDSGYTGSGVLVCLIDAGFNYHDTHEALRSATIAPGRRRDFVEGDTVVTATNLFTLDHGTWVMGCLAGNLPGTYVGSGFGADLALARTEAVEFERPVEMLYWGMGAEWADSLGADVLTSSVGYFQFDGGIGNYRYSDMNGRTTDISRAAQIAASKGILIVNAVGNEGATSWRHLIAPSDVHGDSLIAVGSVSTSGAPASFSSVGPSADGRVKPDLVAAGVAVPIVSTNGDPGSYDSNSGTSLSAPLVAGLAACLLQARPGWTPQQVIRALRETASRAYRPDFQVGYGIPNGRLALEWSPDGPTFRPPGRLGVTLLGSNPWSPSEGVQVATFALGDAVSYPAPARLRVLDPSGRGVRALWSGTLVPGRAERAVWDGLDDRGRPLPPGIYWISLGAFGEVATRRVVLLR